MLLSSLDLLGDTYVEMNDARHLHSGHQELSVKVRSRVDQLAALHFSFLIKD
jgi:hypothetical protein